MATISTLADALVTDLNAGPWGFAAIRDYSPDAALEDLTATSKVVVQPASWTIAMETRGQDRKEYGLAVHFRAKPATTNAALDPLANQVEEVAAYFLGRRLTTLSAAICVVAAVDPIVDAEVLDEQLGFRSQLLLTFRVYE